MNDQDSTQKKQSKQNNASKEEEFVAPLEETFSGVGSNIDDTLVDVINTASDGMKEHHSASKKNFGQISSQKNKPS